LDLLAVGPKFTRPACRAAAAAIDQYLLLASARTQQQTRRPSQLLLTDGTDGQTAVFENRPTYFSFFSDFKKHDFLRFFESLHTFSRTLTDGQKDNRPVYDAYVPHSVRTA